MNGNNGKQCIGCEVTSCRHNRRGCECDLPAIMVKPSCNCHSGDADESMCASYECK
ncbi:MAG: DUF1540 domain-containing protein [Clostridia bacterium]|nr:DUF1540 domain-containing protein [Clostridia bacterium]